MPRFVFKAYGSSGRLETGEVDAESKRLALDVLARRGLFALEIGEGSANAASLPPWWRRDLTGPGSLAPAAQALLAREMSTLLEAGIAVDEALGIIALQPRMSTATRAIVAAVQSDVRSGASLSAALAARDGAIPETFWTLVQAGEAGGRLRDVLAALAGSLEESVRTRRQLVTAMVYPLVLLIASVLTLLLIVMVMGPAVLPLFREAGVEPPVLLAALARAEEIVIGHWPVTLLAIAGVVVAARLATRNEKFAYGLDSAMLRAPLVKDFVQRHHTARLARTLAMLLHNGVPMLDALRISGNVLRNRVFKAALAHTADEVNSGGTLIAPFAASGVLPPLALRLIAVGEESGQLPAMLSQVAAIYEQAVRQQVERIVAVSAPAVTVLIGGLVGFTMLSVVSAMLSLNDVALR